MSANNNVVAAIAGNKFGFINDAGSAWVNSNWSGLTQTFKVGPYASTDAMFIDGAGNVGIGTTNPMRRFDVEGGARFLQDAAATTGAITLRQNSTDTVGAFIQWVNNANATEKGWLHVDTLSNMIFATQSSEKLRITSAGNVGIGTANPQGKLDVS